MRGVTYVTFKAGNYKNVQKSRPVWNENKDYLSEIDSRFGDGDHGVTMERLPV